MLFIVYGVQTNAQCDPPSILWDENGLLVNWIPKTNATDHVLQYRESGTFAWTTVEIPSFTSSFSVTDLEQCIEFDFRVRTICDDEQSNFSTIFRLRPDCNTCYEEYCEIPDLFPSSIHITSFDINGIINESTFNADGYEDFRGELSRRYQPGEEIDVTIDIAPSAFGTPVLGVFIDYDRNLMYDEEDGEEVLKLVFEDGSLQESGSFTIPENVALGVNRLRLVIGTAFDQSVGACEENTNSFSGEVEEYCIIIENPCDLDFAAELDGVDQSGAFFVWEELEIADAYNVRFKKTSESDNDWTDLATLDPEIMIGNLEECTEYEFEVRGVCPFDTSRFKNRIVFESFCPTSTKDFDLVIGSISSYPNPWSSEFTLSLESRESTEITIELLSNIGQSIGQSTRTRLSEGQNKIPLQNFGEVASGIYFVKITDESGNSRLHKTLKIR